MAATDTSLLGQMDECVLDGKFHEATDLFCRLGASGYDIPKLITHAMDTAAPYLHVPSHAHIFRHSRSQIEEYKYNTCREARKNIMFMAWAHYLAFYKKCTLSTECYDLYHRYFVHS